MAEPDIRPWVLPPRGPDLRFTPCCVFMTMKEMRRDGQRVLADLFAASPVKRVLQPTLFFLFSKVFYKSASMARTGEPP
jgi:hypothetical protein